MVTRDDSELRINEWKRVGAPAFHLRGIGDSVGTDAALQHAPFIELPVVVGIARSSELRYSAKG